MNRSEFLTEAEQIICNDRSGQYGQPENNFGKIAEYWSLYLNAYVTAKDVAIMMALFKVARIQTAKAFKADSWVDAIGYLACGGEIAEQE